jgi:predicted ATPase/DNA-binding SARP family transcriptional activator
VELGVFGPIEARGPSGPTTLTRAKERAVLATLALFHGRAVSVDRLIDALWHDGPPRHPGKALQTHIRRLRAALGADVIETRSDGYALAAGVDVDAELFEAEARDGDSARCLRGALARWTGEPYVDLGEWPPAELERERLTALRDHAQETCLGLEIDAGPAAGCVPELEAMVADRPLRERRWLLLMTALQREGRVADALRAYQRARTVFAEELGIDPGTELRALEEQILLADVESAVPGDLPRQLTSFVGRDREVSQLAGLVRARSLVTLTGVGGVGKTRLALEAATEVAADFPDGAWLCELAPVTDPDAVWETLGSTFRVFPTPGRGTDEAVLEYLGSKRLLVILDNCEHLLGAVAVVVSALAQRCPGVVVLATSREGLALAGEQLVAVPSLGVPAAGESYETVGNAEAVRLFCDRARDAASEFVLAEHNADAVAQLCRRLDGIPLAIELAAARVRSLGPDELVARLDQRFTLLTRGSRAALERHQTLRAAIDWSYDLLTNDERSALNRLSVFAGSFDLAAGEALLEHERPEGLDAAEVLGQLVDKSLIQADHDASGSRYRLLETIRQYAQEHLERSGETAIVRGWHLDHYLTLAETAAPHLRSSDQLTWAHTLARDIDNFRTALDYAIDASLADPAFRLITALAVTGLHTNWTVLGWADTARTIPGADRHPLYPLIVAWAAVDAALAGDLDRAAPLLARAQHAQTALGTTHMPVHEAAAAYAIFRGDLPSAQHHAEACVEHARATGDPLELAHALTALASALTNDPQRGAVVAEEAVKVTRDAGLLSPLPFALLVNLLYIGSEDPERELALYDEIIDAATALGDHQLVATTIASRDATKSRRADWPTALRTSVDALEHYRDGGNTMLAIPHLATSAIALAAMEHFEPAAVILGFIDAHATRRLATHEYTAHLTTTDTALLDALGQNRLTDLKTRGSKLSFATATDYLRSQTLRALAP